MVTMNENALTVTQGGNSAKCVLAANGDPAWSGYNDSSGNPLMNMFSNDSIYAPEVVPSALAWAWQRWRESAVTDEVLLDGLSRLFAWIDTTARSKPGGPLWQIYF
jgi:hypothetical protein